MGAPSEDVRRVLSEEARGTQAFVHERGVEMDAAILAELEAAGIRVNEVEREVFLEASQAVYDEFASTVAHGADLLERVRRLSAEGGV